MRRISQFIGKSIDFDCSAGFNEDIIDFKTCCSAVSRVFFWCPRTIYPPLLKE
jgi:hypothetical protein